MLGLATIHPGQPPQKLTPQLRAKVLERTRQAPPDGSTHWSLRKMAAVMKVNKNLIARIWKEADLKPHRLERYMASNDPEFEEKAAAIIGLYLNPPQNAAVFCVDEKSAIQALDRLDRRLPLSPGRAEKHGFEYYRHGTLSLYAALNPQTGEVIGQTAARHTSQEFVDFLDEVVSNQPAGQEIHVILDNFATHKTDLVKRFLQRHPNVRLHFTPTYSSWLNQVESWFSKLQPDVIDRGIFTSIADLKSKIIVPDLFFAEFANVLWKAQRRGRCDARLADSAIRELISIGFPAFPSVSLIEAAIQIARAYQPHGLWLHLRGLGRGNKK